MWRFLGEFIAKRKHLRSPVEISDLKLSLLYQLILEVCLLFREYSESLTSCLTLALRLYSAETRLLFCLHDHNKGFDII